MQKKTIKNEDELRDSHSIKNSRSDLDSQSEEDCKYDAVQEEKKEHQKPE